MKKYIFLFTLLFGIALASQAQFLEPVETCDIAGPNQFVVTHHQTFNYTYYSETEWYGYLVNPCGQNVGSYTLVTRIE